MAKWLILFIFWSTTVFAGDKILVSVEGMTCPMCAGKVENRLKENPEIENVSIDIGVGTVEIALKGGKHLSDQKIRDAISDAGYKALKIK